jgi:hypothetical protein
MAAYILLVLVAHIAWWSKRTYFPNQALCEEAHDRFHLSIKEKEGFGKGSEDLKDEAQDAEQDGGNPERSEKPNLSKDYDKAKKQAEERFWHSIAFRLISQVPGELSISGFFCALVWPVFVILNVLLLAQVVGTQVGEGGGVVDIHPFGAYGAIPLVTAILYAVAQTVFGIMYGEADKKDKKRYLALILLVMAVLLEGGLAVYRAWLIRGGDATAGANLVDSTLAGRFGLVVGAFFGIFFPATHAALGFVGFPHFLRPFIRYALQVAGGICLLALAVGNYLLLAWHPIHPKDFDGFERQRREEEEKLAKEQQAGDKPEGEKQPEDTPGARVVLEASSEENQYAVQQIKLTDLANSLSDNLGALLGRLPVDVADVKKTVQEAADLRLNWSEIAGRARQLVAAASKLDAEKLAAMASKLSAAHPEAEASNPAAEPPETDASRSSEEDAERMRKQAILKEAIEKGRTRLGPLFKVASSYDKLQSAIDAIGALEHELYWQQAKTQGQRILDDVERHQKALPELGNRLAELRKFAKPGLDPGVLLRLCETSLDNLKAQFAAIPKPEATNFVRYERHANLAPLVDTCEVLLDELKKRVLAANAGPDVPTVESLDALKGELDAIPEKLSGAYVSALRALAEAKKAAQENQKRVEGRPRWFYRLADLVA